jgi:hypothetical protein
MAVPFQGTAIFISASSLELPRQGLSAAIFSSPARQYLLSSNASDYLYLERGKMTRIPNLLLLAAIAFLAAYIAPSTAEAQPGYGPPQQRITCSSNDGRRNWCDIGRSRDVRIARQISGSACIQDQTWGIDRRGLWVDRGCRAEFFVGGGRPQGPPPGPPMRIVTCSSDNGKRNWCDVGRSRDVRLARQISGSACIENQTWGIDRRGLWVDRGCRADFRVR